MVWRLSSSTTLRNLGVLFHQDLSLGAYAKHVSRSAFFRLRNRRDAETRVHVLMPSKLEVYCRSLVSFQLVQETAAQVQTRTNEWNRIPLLWYSEEMQNPPHTQADDGLAASHLNEIWISYHPPECCSLSNTGVLVVPWLPRLRDFS